MSFGAYYKVGNDEFFLGLSKGEVGTILNSLDNIEEYLGKIADVDELGESKKHSVGKILNGVNDLINLIDAMITDDLYYYTAEMFSDGYILNISDGQISGPVNGIGYSFKAGLDKCELVPIPGQGIDKAIDLITATEPICFDGDDKPFKVKKRKIRKIKFIENLKLLKDFLEKFDPESTVSLVVM